MLDHSEQPPTHLGPTKRDADYQMMFELANEPILVFPLLPTRTFGKFILVNDEACKLLGYAREQLLQFSPLDLSRPEAADRLPNLIQRLLDTGKVAFEGMYRHASGDYIPLEYRTSLLRTESGDAVLTHARDLRHRNQVLKELETSNFKNRMVFELCPDMIGIVTGDKLTDVNSAGVLLLRAPNREALIGRSFWDFVHPDFHPKIRERLAETRRPGEATRPMEQVYCRDDGSLVRVEVKSTPLTPQEPGQPRHLFLSRDVTNEVAQRDRLHKMAYRDFLTNLWNRRRLLEHLDSLLGSEPARLAVVFLDVDHFKQINDTYGHDIGDLLLSGVAARLQQLETPQLFVARTGGDEFCVVYTDYDSSADVRHLARDIAGRFRQELHLEGCSLRCTTSIGAAEYSKTLANTRDLMKAADIALYRAKELGRDQIAFYTE